MSSQNHGEAVSRTLFLIFARDIAKFADPALATAAAIPRLLWPVLGLSHVATIRRWVFDTST